MTLYARLLGVVVAASLAAPATTAASKYPGGCNTRACLKRSCDTSCKQRVQRKRTERRWRRVVTPYRSWLAGLRACESPSGADSANGRYHGYYQFSESTWKSVGGVGDPHEASLLEQSHRAVLLRKRIGNPHQPAGWPVCG